MNTATIKTNRKIRYQKCVLSVASSGALATFTGAVDQNYDKVNGIQVTCNDANAVEQGTFEKFNLGQKEIYPFGYETKLNYCGRDVAVNDRFDNEIDEEGKGATINISYRDGAVAGTTYPYNVNVYLRLVNPNN